LGTQQGRAADLYDRSQPNDRLLLGLKGTMNEFELTLMRRRLLDAALAKARRGDLRFGVPVGLDWPPGGKIELYPDRPIQDALRSVFRCSLPSRARPARLASSLARSPDRRDPGTLAGRQGRSRLVAGPRRLASIPGASTSSPRNSGALSFLGLVSRGFRGLVSTVTARV
jgi:hypothetical protein